MATIREFNIFDTLVFNNINLDPLTETFHTSFYGKYISKWKEFCIVYENITGNMQGYLLGKIEGKQQNKNWHGHVSAVTVAPESRKQGIAKFLMNYLELITTQQNGFYVDLFVRSTNRVAVQMYLTLGYLIYQTINKYYNSPDGVSEDGYDMRKSMARDPDKKLMQPLNKTIEASQLEFN